ncbi:ATP-binding cassette domain-containing protein [Candidatus Sumerlaeota bacterium]|nr:ATP-binding cassette domain-containing protein [Candidatus Sumerlaeota bacterium]
MPSNSETIVTVENLTAVYNETRVLEDVSFQVRRGEVFVIIGGSGCGKSTLLKHMIGLLRPTAGRVLIDGEDVAQASGRDLRRILNKIGVAYQNGALFGSMTLLENIRLPLEEFTSLPLEAMNLIARMKLKLVGLKGYSGHMPSELSGGMQKRAAIARAMALDPAILFLDEPSAGLDPITSAGLDELVKRLADSLGATFVIVSHELPSILAVADRVIMLDKNTRGIIAEGDPRELRDASDDPRVRSFFNREAAEAAPAGTGG